MQPDGNWTFLVVSDGAATRAALIGCFEADYRVRASVAGRDTLNLRWPMPGTIGC